MGFEFADDHRAFLAAGLPVHPPEMAGRGFPDWRDGDPCVLLSQLAWPVEGLLFDVEHNRLWPEEWGNRPSNRVEALRFAGHRLDSVPRMIPVCVTGICRPGAAAAATRCSQGGRPTSSVTAAICMTTSSKNS